MFARIKKLRKYEEIFNSTSSGVGVLIAIACTAIAVTRAALYGTAWHIVSYSIFGAGMILLYTASTLFHSATNPRKKHILNTFDHSSIYILIAATYTPFSLVGIGGAFGWVLFGIIWGLAVAGIVFKIWFYRHRWRNISAVLYGIMGWIFIMAIVPIVKNFTTLSLIFLLVGCVTYTIGIFFYIRKDIPFGHGIFHLFVLGGSICHFFAMVFLIES